MPRTKIKTWEWPTRLKWINTVLDWSPLSNSSCTKTCHEINSRCGVQSSKNGILSFLQHAYFLTTGVCLNFSSPNYRIAGNIRGRKLSRIRETKDFVEKTFVDSPPTGYYATWSTPIFVEILSRMPADPRNSWKFSLSKVSRYTVVYTMLLVLLATAGRKSPVSANSHV